MPTRKYGPEEIVRSSGRSMCCWARVDGRYSKVDPFLGAGYVTILAFSARYRVC